ncbi:MAG TPA: T9SS type A sorting domain-containing protein [Ignavibacteriaceae bacterium]|nr:T9SS type A sorting domain-containing protein [Ignavibacteriaceae bacterium]
MKKLLLVLLSIFAFSTYGQIFTGSGTYYVGNDGTAPGGTNPHWKYLSGAFAAIDTAGILTGDVTLYITSSIVDTNHAALMVNTNGFNLLIKPLAGTVDTITSLKTTDNAGVSGLVIIGGNLLNMTNIIPTNNVTIDGSNTVGGITKDLIFQTRSTANLNTNALRIFGEANHCTIKNVRVVPLNAVTYGLSVTTRFINATNYTADSLIIENCDIINNSNAGQVIGLSNSGTPTAVPTGIIIRNNYLEGRNRGIFLNYCGNIDIYNNEISMTQPTTGFQTNGIFAYVIGASATDSNYVINIYNNKITKLSTGNAAATDYGAIGINIIGRGKYYVYNNMIGGFATTTTSTDANFKIHGIRVASAVSYANIAYNTIQLPNLTYTPGLGTQEYAAFSITNGYDTLLNNIVVVEQATDTAFAIIRGTSGTMYSNFNDLYVTGSSLTGKFGTTLTPTLTDWRTASGQDSASVTKAVNFVSPIDLHLTGTSIGDMDLAGTPIAWATKDFDGNIRDAGKPYMGADERPESPLPVELISFGASVQGNVVSLSWSTSTEINNSGFEVEKKVNGTWSKIGFVKGNGTTTQMHDYSFVDNNVSGLVSYRLRQVDLDGSYTYTKEVEVNASVPEKFELSQNYPNPFNPNTTIKFNIPNDMKVKLEVYSINGELVNTLVDDYKLAGSYEYNFNASNLASGTYIYRLTAGANVISKKMTLMK